jgi:hypothetical protein
MATYSDTLTEGGIRAAFLYGFIGGFQSQAGSSTAFADAQLQANYSVGLTEAASGADGVTALRAPRTTSDDLAEAALADGRLNTTTSDGLTEPSSAASSATPTHVGILTEAASALAGAPATQQQGVSVYTEAATKRTFDDGFLDGFQVTTEGAQDVLASTQRSPVVYSDSLTETSSRLLGDSLWSDGFQSQAGALDSVVERVGVRYSDTLTEAASPGVFGSWLWSDGFQVAQNGAADSPKSVIIVPNPLSEAATGGYSTLAAKNGDVSEPSSADVQQLDAPIYPSIFSEDSAAGDALTYRMVFSERPRESALLDDITTGDRPGYIDEPASAGDILPTANINYAPFLIAEPCAAAEFFVARLVTSPQTQEDSTGGDTLGGRTIFGILAQEDAAADAQSGRLDTKRVSIPEAAQAADAIQPSASSLFTPAESGLAADAVGAARSTSEGIQEPALAADAASKDWSLSFAPQECLFGNWAVALAPSLSNFDIGEAAQAGDSPADSLNEPLITLPQLTTWGQPRQIVALSSLGREDQPTGNA